jgi:anti-sigma regulatory factor (Ser/Thr protein kinase)
MRLGNGLAAIADGGPALAEFCTRARLSARVVNRIEVIFEEVVANIVRHGFSPGSAQSIRVVAASEGDDVLLVFDDDGVPFDPTGQAPPVSFTRLADAQVGGLGVALVRRLARTVDYSRPEPVDNADFRPVNRLTVRVASDGATGAR